MTAVRSSSKKSLAFITALATVFALALPFMESAEAATVDNSCQLEVTNDTATNPTGTQHTLTATVVNSSTAPCDDPAGYEVDFEIESGPGVTFFVTNTSSNTNTSDDGNTPSAPDATCTAPENGGANQTCQVTFLSNTQGTNVIRAWVDDDKNNATFDADQTEGRWAGPTDDLQGTATAQPGDRTEEDDTDVVSKTWTQGVAQACIDAEPNTATNPSGSDHTITAKATNGNAWSPGDNAGTYDCTGTALANTVVDVTITDDNPDAYIKSVNGTPTGGPSGGGPNTASATTDANGQITVVISCVSGTAANCTGTNQIEVAVQGAATGPDDCTVGGAGCDEVAKTWAPSGTPASFDASPDTDTNEVGQSHVVTCAVTDNFGGGVAGANCDFRVTGSAGGSTNNTKDLDSNALTPAGYFGQCTTGADGTCTASYTSTTVGTDTIRVWMDLNNNDTDDGGGELGETITKTWVAAGQGTADVDVDMSNGTQGIADCDDIANGTDDTNDDATATNQVATAHEVCAERFGPTGVAQAGPITFTIVSGPGVFFEDVNNNGVKDATEPELGTTVTRDEGSCNTAAATFNCVSVYSTATGSTVVEASANGQSAQGTKTWATAATNARNIELTAPAEAEVGSTATASALVIDRYGNPVPGVAVTFSETGPAVITSANPATTGANGVAEVLYVSQTEGTSALSATITTGGTQCANPAGTPAGTTTAGNCTDTATTEWVAEAPATQCEDGVDNDGDGWVDFPSDPGCADAADDDESNEPVVTNHARTAEITKFKHIDLPGKKKPALMVKGQVTVDDGFDACANQVPVKVQIRASGEWITRKTDSTSENGTFKVLIRHVQAKYRVVAPRVELADEHGDIDNCLKAKDVARHDH